MKKIAVIGKTRLTPDEDEELDFLGVLLATHGHELITTAASGTNTSVRNGYERQGKYAIVVAKNVFAGVDHAIIYPDQRLRDRLAEAAVLTNVKHTYIDGVGELAEFVHAVLVTLAKKHAA